MRNLVFCVVSGVCADDRAVPFGRLRSVRKRALALVERTPMSLAPGLLVTSTKCHTTNVARAAFWGGPFVTKNLAFSLTTGPRPSAMLRKNGNGSSGAQISRGNETDLAKEVRRQVAIGSAKNGPANLVEVQDGNSFEGSS
jgi:hypothetical protein